MRTRIFGLFTGVLLFSALAGLTAPPSFATDYFVKYLQTTTTHENSQCGGAALSSPRHGTVVFKRTASTMSATVYLRGGVPNDSYSAKLFATDGSRCGDHENASTDVDFTTDSNGNGTAHLGPAPFFGDPKGYATKVHLTQFWVYVSDFNGAKLSRVGTERVPTHGL